jgi:3-oxoacyl-[acyl-carrier-protein] synthase-3
VTSLAAVACYLPETRVPIEDLADGLELADREVRVFRRFHGLAEICQDQGRTLDELLASAVDNLAELRGQEHLVRYVIYTSGIGAAVPYPINPLQEVCARFGLGHATAFTITHHACAGMLLAVDMAGRLLADDGDPAALALVLSGEKTFTRDAQIVVETTIFGEAAAACLVSAGGPSDRLLAYACSLRGDFDGWLDDPAVMAARYTRAYPDCLAEVLLAAAEQAGLALSDIDLILPHNVNVVSWRRLCKRLAYPFERVLLDNVGQTGHCFASDGMINYRTAVDRGRLRPGDRYLIAAAGLGAVFSAMVFQH